MGSERMSLGGGLPTTIFARNLRAFIIGESRGTKGRQAGGVRERERESEEMMRDSRLGVLLKAFFFKVTSLRHFLLVNSVLSAAIPLDDAH